MTFKKERMASEIKRQLSILIRDLKNMSLQSKQIYVTQVHMSKDCSCAKIYISSMKGSIYKKQAIKVLQKTQGYLRHELSKTLRVKKVPILQFIADDSLEIVSKLEDMLLNLKKES